jgi:hypothetical protein
MHPVKYLFEEINRDYWGIPQTRQGPVRKLREAPAWQQERPARRVETAK